MCSPQTHTTTDKTRHHTPAAAGVWCYLGDVSNEHATDENAPSEWPREPHPPQQYHTPTAAGVWYYKILDLNPNEPPTPNPPNEHPRDEDPASRTRNPPNDPNPPS
ncbi:hypothetical protein BS47DRAFT_1369606 [Hydnum rufescens UP504]|uniref:Uncharacterized protein n=1 Tax=Hydnum rufescens UP504 TaxID=1448309 RepID=A0A9P6ACD6_9AGAM|nr:hypothetical protein BS47DRAFT_1369606 [Hydnum rufescens UP504]